MAPSNVDYQENKVETMNYNHKKFEAVNYTHKKFGKKSSKEVTPTQLFRPYALNDNTPRKRRQDLQQQNEQTHIQHQLPPTPPTTPPQQHHQQPQQHLHQQHPHQEHPHQQHYPQSYLSTGTPINHQAYSYMLQKQRAVLQMRQLLAINPDANTWPLEWRQALQSLLQQ